MQRKLRHDSVQVLPLAIPGIGHEAEEPVVHRAGVDVEDVGLALIRELRAGDGHATTSSSLSIPGSKMDDSIGRHHPTQHGVVSGVSRVPVRAHAGNGPDSGYAFRCRQRSSHGL